VRSIPSLARGDGACVYPSRRVRRSLPLFRPTCADAALQLSSPQGRPLADAARVSHMLVVGATTGHRARLHAAATCCFGTTARLVPLARNVPLEAGAQGPRDGA
jgi:hypothetical protein